MELIFINSSLVWGDHRHQASVVDLGLLLTPIIGGIKMSVTNSWWNVVGPVAALGLYMIAVGLVIMWHNKKNQSKGAIGFRSGNQDVG